MINKETYIEGVSCPNPKYVEHLEDKLIWWSNHLVNVQNYESPELLAEAVGMFKKEVEEKSSPKRTPWYG